MTITPSLHVEMPTPTQREAAEKHATLKQRIAAKARKDSPIVCTSASERHPSRMASPVFLPPSPPVTKQFGSPVNPAMTFASFVRGASNEIVFSAALIAAKSPGQYNPLVLHGRSGLGKTHLLNAIANAARSAIYITGGWFNSNLSDRRELSELGKQVIIIDEIHAVRRGEAQHDLLDLINWGSNCKQVVVSCDLPLCEYDLDPKIISRLSGGLVLQVHRPDREVRYGILKQRFATSGIALPDNYLYYMADQIAGSARDIEGAVHRLAIVAQVQGIPIDMAAITQALSEMVKRVDVISVAEIQKMVSRFHNQRHADMLSQRRTAAVVIPRQIAMYLAKQLTPKSLPEIGRRFGGRDHTTVLHAIRKIEALMKTDKNLEKTVQVLMRQIQVDRVPNRLTQRTST